MNADKRLPVPKMMAALVAIAALALALPADAARGGGGGGHGGGGHGGGRNGGHANHSGGGHGNHGGHHGSGHHHHRGGFVAGVFIGGALWPWWYPAPYDIVYDAPIWLPPPAIDPADPGLQQGAAEYWWYFCPDSQIYYPYVQQCASEWQRVQPR
jgi:hypothetical protein